MSKLQVAVPVEVTEEVIRTGGGKEKQVVYVDLGERYPIKCDVWINDGRPLTPGRYEARRLRKKGFDIVVDLERLDRAGPVPASAGKSA